MRKFSTYFANFRITTLINCVSIAANGLNHFQGWCIAVKYSTFVLAKIFQSVFCSRKNLAKISQKAKFMSKSRKNLAKNLAKFSQKSRKNPNLCLNLAKISQKFSKNDQKSGSSEKNTKIADFLAKIVHFLD